MTTERRAERPNIVFIMADQLRPDFLGCYDAAFVNTPHIDSLAERGVLYSHAYSPHPVCVPARVALLTGMDAVKTGVLDNGLFLRPDYAACGIPIWPEMLAQAGYYTAAIGKMHFYPWDLRLGFQYRSIAEDKRWIHIRDDYYHFLRAHGLRKLHGNEHEGYFEHKGAIINRIPWKYSIDHFVGLKACRFIETYGREGPFAMMIGFPGPHCPYDPSPEFLEGIREELIPEAIPEVPGDAPEVRRQNIEGNKQPWNGVDYSEFTAAQKHKIRLHYAALVRQIDYEVGQILEVLRSQGLLDQTVILFTSDHGDYLGDHNLIGKGTFFESSVRIPLIVSPPGSCEPRSNRQMVTLTDVTATLLRFAGQEVPENMDALPLPGLDLGDPAPRQHLVGSVAGGWMIQDGAWRLTKYATGETLLFNLLQDPQEQHNLLRDANYREVYDRLDHELTRTIMHQMVASYHERRVYVRDLSQDPSFGREGWQRPYPRPLQDR